MGLVMYHNEFIQIIEKILRENFDKNMLAEYLMDMFDCEKIYDSDDELITDVFFVLKHYASGEENVSKEELIFFLNCLLGKCEYSLEEKMRTTTKPLI